MCFTAFQCLSLCFHCLAVLCSDFSFSAVRCLSLCFRCLSVPSSCQVRQHPAQLRVQGRPRNRGGAAAGGGVGAATADVAVRHTLHTEYCFDRKWSRVVAVACRTVLSICFQCLSLCYHCLSFCFQCLLVRFLCLSVPFFVFPVPFSCVITACQFRRWLGRRRRTARTHMVHSPPPRDPRPAKPNQRTNQISAQQPGCAASADGTDLGVPGGAPLEGSSLDTGATQ